MARDPVTFDRGAAVTRSLLGWGVVAGPFYVVVGLILASTRQGFDLRRHALSLLTLGEHGWLQRANLVVSAVMVLAAAYGILRALRSGRGLAVGALTGGYAGCLVLSAVFRPDPAEGFPPGAADGASSTSGVLHLLAGGVGFVCLAAAAFAYGRWASKRGETAQSRVGAGCGLVIAVGFLGGAALAASPVGVGLLWLAVLAGWAWLASASIRLYTLVPHPVLAERAEPPRP